MDWPIGKNDAIQVLNVYSSIHNLVFEIQIF